MRRHFFGFLICAFITGVVSFWYAGHRVDYESEDGYEIRIRRGHVISSVKDGEVRAERVSRKKIYYSEMLDVDGDGKRELLILLGSPRINAPKELCIFKDDLSYVVKDFSVTRLNPIDFTVGEMNDDGVRELLMLVYKTSRLHPVYMMRPFFYQVSGETLKPIWRGSRLSAPFSEILLNDIDGDGVDELFAVEYNRYRRKYIRAYRWNGFGFTAFATGKDYLDIHELSTKGNEVVVRVLGRTEMFGQVLLKEDKILIKEMKP